MSKPCQFLLLLTGLLGLSGCPGDPDCFDGGVSDSGNSTMGAILVGAAVSLRVEPSQQQSSCSNDIEPPVPESLSVEISDPDNLPVDNQATLGSPSSGSASVRFTATKQGRYHVLAAFAPVGGIQQFDIYAARNRSVEAPLQTLPFTKCSSLERTRSGGWTCDSDFWRDGVRVRQFSGFRLAVSGDVVWAVSNNQLQRWVDTGTELQLTGAASNLYGVPQVLLPGTDELVTLHNTVIQRSFFDGAQLASTGSTLIPARTESLGLEGLTGVLLRTGDQLALVSGEPRTFSSFTVLKVCPYRLQQGTFLRTSADCQLISGDVAGFEPNILWLASRQFSGSPFTDDVRRLEWTGTALVEQASLPLGQSFRVTSRSPGTRNTLVPTILPFGAVASTGQFAALPVYSSERRSLLLEVLDTALTDPDASASLLWGNISGTSAQVRIRTRPSTP